MLGKRFFGFAGRGFDVQHEAMNENPASRSSPASSFRKLFATGVIGWLAGMVLLFGAAWVFSKPETVSVAMLWMVSHWWIAFLLGLVLLVVRGVVSKMPLCKALGAYVVPVAVIVGLAALCLAIYPDSGLRSDLFTYLPVVVLFYLFGSLWMSGGRETGDSPAFLRAVIPALVGGLMILGFVAFPAFASDSFTYRNAFVFTVSGTQVKDGTIISEGSLEIRKPGMYAFAAPRYVWDMAEAAASESSEPQVENGELQWGASGAPKDGGTGVFPLKIVWRKGIPAGGLAQIPPYEDMVLMEVRKTDENSKLVYCLSAPMIPGSEAP
jgi:hypothetical protein